MPKADAELASCNILLNNFGNVVEYLYDYSRAKNCVARIPFWLGDLPTPNDREHYFNEFLLPHAEGVIEARKASGIKVHLAIEGVYFVRKPNKLLGRISYTMLKEIYKINLDSWDLCDIYYANLLDEDENIIVWGEYPESDNICFKAYKINICNLVKNKEDELYLSTL